MLVFIVYGFFACQSKDSKTISEPSDAVDLRPNVRVQSVEEQVFVRTLSLPATVFAQRSAILVPKAQGRIESVNVQIGDTVKAGDVLMTVESNDYFAGYTEIDDLVTLKIFAISVYF